MSRSVIAITDVEIHGEMVRLTRPIRLELSRSAQSGELAITGVEPPYDRLVSYCGTCEDPAECIGEDLEVLYDEFAVEDDDRLTQGAQELKRDLRELFGLPQ